MVAADRAQSTGTGYRIPATYSDSRNGGYSSLTTLDVYFVDDLEIENTEYTESIVSWNPGSALQLELKKLLDNNFKCRSKLP
jgi:hypothetical protein